MGACLVGKMTSRRSVPYAKCPYFLPVYMSKVIQVIGECLLLVEQSYYRYDVTYRPANKVKRAELHRRRGERRGGQRSVTQSPTSL